MPTRGSTRWPPSHTLSLVLFLDLNAHFGITVVFHFLLGSRMQIHAANWRHRYILCFNLRVSGDILTDWYAGAN